MHPDDHKLSVEQLDSIFDKQIRPYLFSEAKASEHPLLILVGAQPGAGKTRAGEDAIAESGQDVVALVGDSLRKFHPDYDVVMEQEPADMPSATAQAVGGWVERAIKHAAKNKISVLIEGTFRRPDVTIGTARDFKDAGFSAHVILVAASPEQSHLSIAGRFVEDDREHGAGRFTTLKSHDESFLEVRNTLAAVTAAQAPVDRLTVRTRENVIFAAEHKQNSRISGALTVVDHEWNRPFTADELEDWERRAEDIVGYLNETYPADGNIRDLAIQIGLDRKYIDFTRSGQVAVRGHVRDGHEVEPYVRSRPARG